MKLDYRQPHKQIICASLVCGYRFAKNQEPLLPMAIFRAHHGNDGNQEEWDYFWPFIRTVRGEKTKSYQLSPLYSKEERKETSKRWLMWPLLKQEGLHSDIFPRTGPGTLLSLFGYPRGMAAGWRGKTADDTVASFCI